jgi:hypothetical protein
MKQYLLVLSISILAFFSSCDKQNAPEIIGNGATDSLKINQIQVIASHNSYHIKPSDTIQQFLNNLLSLGLLPAQYDPSGIDYSHLPFDQQFNDYNVRGLEIDIYNDPVGGQFYSRKGVELTGGVAESNIPELQQPGFKVIHIPDFDFGTHHYTFKTSLQAVADWSNAHPNHIPLFINVETKDDAPGDVITGFGLTESIPYDATACNKLDEEIKAVFGENLDKVITPDDVRGNYSTLREAVLAGNWPQLAQARGKVIFIMQGATESLYKVGHPSLQGRAMFVYSSYTSDEAAFVVINNATTGKAQITQRVQEGFMVRTRSDAGTNEARTGDYTDMNNAFESGAQITSTDYYKADDRAGTAGWTDFRVQFPNGELARINHVSAIGKTDLGVIKE